MNEMLTKSQEIAFIRDGSIAELLTITNYTRTADELVDYLNKRQLIQKNYTLTDRDCEALHIYPHYLPLYQNCMGYHDLYMELFIWYKDGYMEPTRRDKYLIPYQLIEWYNGCINNSNVGPLTYIGETLSILALVIYLYDLVGVQDDSKPLKPLDIHSPQKREDISRRFNSETSYGEGFVIKELEELGSRMYKTDYPYKKKLSQDMKAYITYLKTGKRGKVQWE